MTELWQNPLTLDLVREAIKDHPEFIIVDKGNYIYVDYIYCERDTFDCSIRRECRGVKFHPDGTLMARPFHKFFNYGEKPESTNISWDREHVVMDKLDGSMVHPALIDHTLVWMTRKGITDVADDAADHATDRIEEYCRHQIKAGNTPIFEYVGPDNRIVIKYDQPALVQIGLRSNQFGIYYDEWPEDIPQTTRFPAVTDHREFMESVRALKGREGVVIKFLDSTMLKIKAEDYVLKHRAKELINQERNLVALILDNELDDIIPIMDAGEQADLIKYQSEVFAYISKTVIELMRTYQLFGYMSRKKYAEAVMRRHEGAIRSAAFRVLDGDEAHDALIRSLRSLTSNARKFEQFKELTGLSYVKEN